MSYGPPDSPCDLCSYPVCGMCGWTEEEFEEYENGKTEAMLDREENKYEAGFNGNW